ncbi:hypothetical protein CC79DRAFT_1393696 [Sarocladium strictum]
MTTKIFKLNKVSFPSRRYDLSSGPSSPVILSADVSKYTPNKPDVTLHQSGSDLKGPVVAASFIARERKTLHVGISPPGAKDMDWHSLRRGRRSNSYSFAFMLDDGTQMNLSWKKTGLLDGGIGFRLTDDRGVVMAEFKRNMTLFESAGSLELSATMGLRFETMVFISLLSIIEMKKREDAQIAKIATIA